MIADDHQIFLDGLRSLLGGDPQLEVLGVALNGKALLEQVGALRPDVVLLDINMPEMDGAETARHLKEKHPEVRILILTMHESAPFVKRLLEIGVDGYALKNSSKAELLAAIQAVHKGKQYYSHQVVGAVMDSLRGTGKTPADEVELTPRELDVLRLLAQEFTTPEIAEKLFISPHTVESHRKNLLSKLGKKNTAGLVAWAVKMGLG